MPSSHRLRLSLVGLAATPALTLGLVAAPAGASLQAAPAAHAAPAAVPPVADEGPHRPEPVPARS
ncbi:MAG: hypothetical protein M3P96_09150 [Actinomycetota bacterium]|nr:hypothetical protein [Actinomycetota bacterium]